MSADLNAYGHYWTAQGKVNVNAKGSVVFPANGNDDDYSPRCVYDEWYWNKIDKEHGYVMNERETEFLWGDVDKDDSQK